MVASQGRQNAEAALASLLTRVNFRRATQAVAGACSCALLARVCLGCEFLAHWPDPYPRLLALAGLVFSGTMLVLARQEEGKSQYVADGLLCILLLGGFWLATAAFVTGTSYCKLCLAFWSCQAAAFLEFALSDRKLAQIGVFIPLPGLSLLAAGAFVPAFQTQLADWLPRVVPAHNGPIAGQPFPQVEGLPSSGYVALATQCAPCMRAGLAVAVNKAELAGQSITVLALPTDKFVTSQFPKVHVIREPQSFFDRLSMKAGGPPVILQLVSGRVVQSEPPATFKFAR